MREKVGAVAREVAQLKFMHDELAAGTMQQQQQQNTRVPAKPLGMLVVSACAFVCAAVFLIFFLGVFVLCACMPLAVSLSWYAVVCVCMWRAHMCLFDHPSCLFLIVHMAEVVSLKRLHCFHDFNLCFLFYTLYFIFILT